LTRLVADSSLTLAWYLDDEESAYADAAHAALTNGAEAIVPPLWPYEVANGLCMAERRGRLQAADIPRVLALLSPLPIEVETTGYERARQEVLELARKEGLTVYDAAYVELAMRHGIALATFDRSLRDAARRVGVTLFQP
jgi:predicted nucleic acid-binding protein